MPGLYQCFNPYRVFSSAETILPHLLHLHRAVSIPIGFSHQLRRARSGLETVPRQVSIPIGFSHQLRQSISNPGIRKVDEVSIPIGFSHQLRLIRSTGIRSEGMVSIPIGFSHQLRQKGTSTSSPDQRQFQSLSGFLIS